MPFSNKRILCIDDEPDACRMLRARLQQINADYQIIAVEDAVKAINLIASQSFDLYIIDNWLGGASGIDVCRWIRKNDQYTPILFFSALSGASDRQEAMEAGANAYLVKANDLDILTDTIKLLLI